MTLDDPYLTQISRARHYSTFNISNIAKKYYSLFYLITED